MGRKVDRYEDLIAWQKAMELVVGVYEVTSNGRLARDFALKDQIHRAAISIPSNLAEGFERGTRTEFHRYVTIAKASCAELRTHIHIARRIGHIPPSQAEALLASAEELSRIIGALRASLARAGPA